RAPPGPPPPPPAGPALGPPAPAAPPGGRTRGPPPAPCRSSPPRWLPAGARGSPPHAPPQSRAETRIGAGGELGGARKAGPERLRRHPRILGRVHRTSVEAHHRVHLLEALQRRLPPIGQVERQRPSRPRKREQPRRRQRPEGLQHRQEGPLVAGG